MSQEEVAEFLRTTIIPEINLQETLLVDALKIINQEIAKQIPDDQPRPRIIPDESLSNEPTAIIANGIRTELEPTRINEMHFRNISASTLLESTCDATKCGYWIYQGNIYVGNSHEFMLDNGFYQERIFSQVQLDATNGTQLSQQMDQLIQASEYYGYKPSFQIIMSDKARAALHSGEVHMPTIHLNMQNTTISDVLLQIARQTDGVLVPRDGGLHFKPFGNSNDYLGDNDPLRPRTIDEILNNPNRETTPASGLR